MTRSLDARVQELEHAMFGSRGRGGLIYEVEQLKSGVSLLSAAVDRNFAEVKSDIKQLLDHALSVQHGSRRSSDPPTREPEGISVRGRFTTRTLVALLTAAGIGGGGYAAYRAGHHAAVEKRHEHPAAKERIAPTRDHTPISSGRHNLAD